MRTGISHPSPASGAAFDPEAEVLALAGQTARMVAVMQALVASHRHVDFQGLQNHVGLLCAKALDLPPSKTGFLRLELQQVSSSLDLLSATMRENSA